MKELRIYIEKILGETISLTNFDKESIKQFPLYISSVYSISKFNLFGRNICLLKIKEGNEFTPEQLSKHKATVEEIVDIPVVFLFNRVESYNTKRYIKYRLNFIVLGKLLFIPELMMDIRKVQKEKSPIPKELTPVAQFILFFHLQKHSLEGNSIKQIAELLQMSYLNINRGINVLKELGICTLYGSKEKSVHFELCNKELWNKSLLHITTPIQKKLYTDEKLDYLSSGINALSHYTMLNDESREYYAISKNDYRNHEISGDTRFGENVIEVWKYDPKPLSNNGYIDKLSVYALLKGDTDERIQIELNQLIEQMQW